MSRLNLKILFATLVVLLLSASVSLTAATDNGDDTRDLDDLVLDIDGTGASGDSFVETEDSLPVKPCAHERQSIAIVVPSLRRAEPTLKTLRAIFEHTAMSTSCYSARVILANGMQSAPSLHAAPSAEAPSVLAPFDRFPLHVESYRFGHTYAHTINTVVNQLLEDDFDFYVFLNNSAPIDGRWLPAMLESFYAPQEEGKPAVGVAAGLVLDEQRNILSAGVSVRSVVHDGLENKTLPYHNLRGYPADDSRVGRSRLLVGATNCLMIRGSLWRKLRGFEKIATTSFFEDNPELHLTLRVSLEEAQQVKLVPEARVIHQGDPKTFSSGYQAAALQDLGAYEAELRFDKRWASPLRKIVRKNLAFRDFLVTFASSAFVDPDDSAAAADLSQAFVASNVPMRIQDIYGANGQLSETHDLTTDNESLEEKVAYPAALQEMLEQYTQQVEKTDIQRVRRKYIAVMQNFPGNFVRPDTLKAIGITSYPVDRVPRNLIENLELIDQLWVNSEFTRKALLDSNYSKSVSVLHWPIDLSFFDPDATKPLTNDELPGRKGFNFFSRFVFQDRTAGLTLLSAYVQEFSGDDDVCLFLHVRWHDDVDFATAVLRDELNKQGRDLPEDMKEYNLDIDGTREFRLKRSLEILAETDEGAERTLPCIQFVSSRFMRYKHRPSLLKTMDAFVLPSRAEPDGRAIQEAMAMEMPTIALNWGPPSEFLSPENSFEIENEGQVPLSELLQAEFPADMWHDDVEATMATPSLQSLREQMRRVYSEPRERRARGAEARKTMSKGYSIGRIAKTFKRTLKELTKSLRNQGF